MKTFEIEGSNISDIESFYDEIQRVLCPSFKEFGRNMAAFDDILMGGFGEYEYEEPIEIAWKDSEVSRQALGYEETAKYYDALLVNAHPTNIDVLEAYGKEAAEKTGPTLFDTIVETILEHNHISLSLK